MPLLQWVAVAAAFALVGTLSFLFGDRPSVPSPTVEAPVVTIIPGAPSAIPPVSTSLSTLVRQSASHTTENESAPPVVHEPPPSVPPVSEPSVVPEPFISSPPLPSPVEAVEELNTTVGLLRGALVNIICIPEDRDLRSVSGTGIMIDARGLILTVAHVGQYFLLRDYGNEDVACVVRTGSPARSAYEAKLAYLSPQWIRENPDTLVHERPTGTGEYDFALLMVTESVSASTLPSSFAHVSLAETTDALRDGDPVAVGSYGAEFLDSAQVRSSLYPSIVFGDVKNIYTFDEDTVDLFSVGIGVSAQQGSSGGGILDGDDALSGLITTRSARADFSQRNVNAITMGHIRRSFEDDTGEAFNDYLADHSLSALSRLFSVRADALAEILADAIHNAR